MPTNLNNRRRYDKPQPFTEDSIANAALDRFVYSECVQRRPLRPQDSASGELGELRHRSSSTQRPAQQQTTDDQHAGEVAVDDEARRRER